MRAFCACDNGKDYILEIKDKSREILQINIATRKRFRFLFNSPREALEQFNMWIDKSDLRLPLSFYVRSDVLTNVMRSELERQGLPFPPANALKKFVKYQRYEDGDEVGMVAQDAIDAAVIPEITVNFLNRMNHKPTSRPPKQSTQLAGGML